MRIMNFAALLIGTSVIAEVKNVTLYRITPRNYTGVTDLDTGDPYGDAFFGTESNRSRECDLLTDAQVYMNSQHLCFALGRNLPWLV